MKKIISIAMIALVFVACAKEADNSAELRDLAVLVAATQQQTSQVQPQDVVAVQLAAQSAISSSLSAFNLNGNLRMMIASARRLNASPRAVPASFTCVGQCRSNVLGTNTISGSQSCFGGGTITAQNVTFTVTRSDLTGYDQTVEGTWIFNGCSTRTLGDSSNVVLNGTAELGWSSVILLASPDITTATNSRSKATAFSVGTNSAAWDLKMEYLNKTRATGQGGEYDNDFESRVSGIINGRPVETTQKSLKHCGNSGCVDR